MLSGLGLSEILIILLVTLVVFGPEKIPDAARTVGKTIRQIRSAGNMFRDMFMLEEGQRPADAGHRFDGQKRRVGPALDRPVSHEVARRRRERRNRPVLIDRARSSVDTRRVDLPQLRPTDEYRTEMLSEPRPGARL